MLKIFKFQFLPIFSDLFYIIYRKFSVRTDFGGIMLAIIPEMTYIDGALKKREIQNALNEKKKF